MISKHPIRLILAILLGLFCGPLYSQFCPSFDSFRKISDTTQSFSSQLSNTDNLGWSVSNIGDINGDGIVDIAATAHQDDDGGTDRGAVYIFKMKANGSFISYQKISDTQGNFPLSLSNGDAFGTCVRGLGDLNNDGIPDIGVGAKYDSDGGTGRGAIYVIYLDTNGSTLDAVKISSTTGGSIPIANGSRFGRELANIGDVNGDGFDDLAVGATLSPEGGTERGCVYVLFLDSADTAVSYSKISATVGTFSQNTENIMRFGTGIERFIDLNEDGRDEILVSAPGKNGQTNDDGIIYLLFLDSVGAVDSFYSITAGTNWPVYPASRIGAGLRTMNDITGDCVPELIVGSRLADVNGTNDGAAYIVSLDSFGNVLSSYEISDDVSPMAGHLDAGDQFGFGISPWMDSNCDGVVDLVIGSREDDDGGFNRGAFYISFISDTCSSNVVEFSMNSSNICPGDTIEFQNTSIMGPCTGYFWSVDSTISDSTFNFQFSSIVPDTFIIELQAAEHCYPVYSEQVIVSPNQYSDAGNDTLICLGDTIQLYGSGSGDFLWTPSTSLDSLTIPNPMAYPSITTEYLLIAGANTFCSDTDTVVITVAPNPTIILSGNDTICEGDTAQLTATVSGGSNGYWLPPTSLSNASIANPLAFPTASTVYTYNAQSDEGCRSADSLSITVNPLPFISIIGTDSIVLGDSAQLFASGAFGYLWGPASNISSITSFNPHVFPTISSWYWVTGTDINGCSATDSIWIEVLTETIGLDEVYDDIRVYPNPATNSIYVERDDAKPLNYHLFSHSGRLINSSWLHSNTTSIDISLEPDGLYYLTIESDQGIRLLQFVKTSSNH